MSQKHNSKKKKEKEVVDMNCRKACNGGGRFLKEGYWNESGTKRKMVSRLRPKRYHFVRVTVPD